jgi:Zn-dependent protease with chaperone function
MHRIDWPVLLGLEALAVGLALAIAYVVGRGAVHKAAADPQRRGAAVFTFARWTSELPFLTLVAPYVIWYLGRHAPRSDGAGDWLFAIGWTAFVATWLGLARLRAAVLRGAGFTDFTPSSVLGTSLFAGWWYVVPPLLAGWAVVAFAGAAPVPPGPDPTPAICFLAAVVASGPLVTWPLNRCMAAAKDLPAPLLAEFERLAGDGERPAVAAAPMRRIGLSDGLAHRYKRAPRISIDDAFAARATPAEGTAILLHELGHHRLGHLRRREWTWKGCLLAVVIVPTLLGFGHVVVFVIGLLLAHRFVLLRIWRRQELEADRFAAERCGAPALAAALTSLHRERGLPDDFGRARGRMMHPDLKRRIAALGLDPAAYPAPKPD